MADRATWQAPGAADRRGGDDLGTPPGSWDVLLSAAWFGLVVGLLELGLLMALKPLRDPSPGFFRMNRHAVWMIPTVDLLLFLVAGLPVGVLARFRPRLASRLAASLFSYLGFLTLLLTYRRLYAVACLLLACGLAYRLSRRIDRNEARFRRLVVRTLPALAVLVTALAGASFHRNVLASGGPPPAAPPAAANAPNVLLIVLDTVRADRLSVYGYGRPTTPGLERLARRGVRFEHARSTAPWTLPSHSSIMTGRWPHQLSADLHGPLDATFPTLAEYLSSKGYDTGGFVANLTYTGAETGLGRGFSHYEDHDLSPTGILSCSAFGSRIIGPVLAGDRLVGHPDELLSRKDAAEVGRQLLDWLARRPEGRPFFAFLNLYDAHNPYIPPREFRRHFGLRPEDTSDKLTLLDWFIRDKGTLSPRQVRLVNDAYDDCLASLDEQLGRLLDELGRRGQLENTLVIVTADHGEHFGEHGLYGHASSLYDQEVHVPLLVVAPGAVPEGRRIDPPVSLRDLAATVVDLAGLGADAPFPGRSLARHWDPDAASADAPPDSVLSEVDEPVKSAPNQGRSPVFRGAMKSLVADGKVYIRNGDGVEELYDAERDPGQSRDIAGTPEARPLLELFRKDLRRLLDDEPPREPSR